MTRLLVLAGSLLCLAALVVPLSDFRDSALQRERQAGQRWREFTVLRAKVAPAPSRAAQDAAAEASPLFAVVNRCATESGIAKRMEQLRPRGETADRLERVDVRLNGLHQEMVLRFLQTLEREADLILESCVLSRTGQNRLDLSLVVARGAAPR